MKADGVGRFSGCCSHPRIQPHRLEFPREEEERKEQPMSLSITDVRAEGPVKEGAVSSEGTEVTSTAEMAKEPGKALPTLHHLPDGEQAQ